MCGPESLVCLRIAPLPCPSYAHAVSAEQTVGAGVADILRAVPIAVVDFTNVAKGDGDAEIVVEASMIIGTPQVWIRQG